jgi:hypothetical protein
MILDIVRSTPTGLSTYRIFDGTVQAKVRVPVDMNPPRILLELKVTSRRALAPVDVVNILTLGYDEILESGLLACAQAMDDMMHGKPVTLDPSMVVGGERDINEPTAAT